MLFLRRQSEDPYNMKDGSELSSTNRIWQPLQNKLQVDLISNDNRLCVGKPEISALTKTRLIVPIFKNSIPNSLPVDEQHSNQHRHESHFAHQSRIREWCSRHIQNSISWNLELPLQRNHRSKIPLACSICPHRQRSRCDT